LGKTVNGIFWGQIKETAEPIVESAVSARPETLELTMNTPAACDIIKAVVALFRKRLIIGGGTMLNMEQLNAALSAGAGFIVSAVVIEEVVTYCR
jgi:2-dehydro-3-deoxyphosphogluconate aldolase / (4S)-4-hydroxy-2-oxoglutarate aldolase